MQVNMDRSSEEGYWLDYGEDEPNLELLIRPLTPPVDEQCTEKAMVRPAQVNGRFHRQAPQASFKVGPYMRAVFVECVQGWRQIDPTQPGLTDQTGKEIPYSAEAKEAISVSHLGMVRTGFQLAQALGDISIEQVRTEREAFRRTNQIPPRVAEPSV